jgi:hypothetical protein
VNFSHVLYDKLAGTVCAMHEVSKRGFALIAHNAPKTLFWKSKNGSWIMMGVNKLAIIEICQGLLFGQMKTIATRKMT